MSTSTFHGSFNQHLDNISLVRKIVMQAEYMFLKPVVKVHYSIVSITVECDTPHELKLLTKMYNELQVN